MSLLAQQQVILAGDVGGTNARFMLFTAEDIGPAAQGKKAPGKLLYEHVYQNETIADFTEMIAHFLKQAGRENASPPLVACIGIAGTVVANKCVMTNRSSWVIDGYALGQALGIRDVRLINDFVAAGYGLLTLDLATKDVEIIQEGNRRKGGVIACVGSGTGLGETFLTAPHGTEVYDAYPTEGGHAALAARDSIEFEMIQWLKARLNTGHLSIERVVSGQGLVNMYDFFTYRHPDKIDQEVQAEIAAGRDKAAAIAQAAQKKGSLCEAVLTKWATHFGAEAGIACLKYVPHGGLFLAGGMTPKLVDWLKGKEGPFLKSFNDQGRVSTLVKDIPVYAVLADDIGQRGAHYVAYMMLQKEKKEIALELTFAAEDESAAPKQQYSYPYGLLALLGAGIAYVSYISGKRSVLR